MPRQLAQSGRQVKTNIRFDNYFLLAGEPSSVTEALQSPEWKQAMDDEFESHHQNKTWTLVDLPSGAQTHGCRWVFKYKYKADGTPERANARLVAKG